jgi:outer membrane protein OmpA-like peptidoglycan-associated protein
VALLAFFGPSRDAGAQGAISAERFQPAPGPGSFVTVETARISGDMAFSFGMVASYAYDPFRLLRCVPSACSTAARVDRLDVIQHLFTANLLAALQPLPRLQIGLRVPLTYASGQGVVTDPTSAQYGEAQPGGVAGFTLGDPAIELKLRALGQTTSPVTAGLSTLVSVPVGHATSPSIYVGDASAVVVIRAIVDADLDRFFFAANAGAALRGEAHLGTLDLGPEFRAAAAAGVKITPEARIAVEGFGSTNFTTRSGTNAAEIDLEGRYRLPRVPVTLLLGAGAGINQGVGSPLFRVFAGASVNLEKVREGAGSDTDQDGIPDADDMCPHEGGDVVRVHGKFYGCPKRDSDGDGIPDHLDACPDLPGVASQDPKLNGCPDPDRDHDGIPNEKDKCPDQPETYNGFQDEDGCPDVAPVKVEVRSDQIVVNENINFAFNSDVIAGSRSFEALNLVAEAMQTHAEIKRLEVAGHTDDQGTRDFNLDLSRRRAASVVTYLAGRGIDKGRLVSNGYGPDKPVAPNDTEQGRAANRRVQFNILTLFK